MGGGLVCVCVSVCVCVTVCACDMLLVSIRNELIVVWELNLEERGVSKVSRSMVRGSINRHSSATKGNFGLLWISLTSQLNSVCTRVAAVLIVYAHTIHVHTAFNLVKQKDNCASDYSMLL